MDKTKVELQEAGEDFDQITSSLTRFKQNSEAMITDISSKHLGKQVQVDEAIQ